MQARPGPVVTPISTFFAALTLKRSPASSAAQCLRPAAWMRVAADHVPCSAGESRTWIHALCQSLSTTRMLVITSFRGEAAISAVIKSAVSSVVGFGWLLMLNDSGRPQRLTKGAATTRPSRRARLTEPINLPVRLCPPPVPVPQTASRGSSSIRGAFPVARSTHLACSF